MTTTNDKGNALDAFVKKANNTFSVGPSHRTNPLSKVVGGGSVKVVYADGSSRIYDKIKNTNAYISQILNNVNSSIVSAIVIDDAEVFEWN